MFLQNRFYLIDLHYRSTFYTTVLFQTSNVRETQQSKDVTNNKNTN